MKSTYCNAAASPNLFAACRLFFGGSWDFGDKSSGSLPRLAAYRAGQGDPVARLRVPAVGGLPVPGDLEVLSPAWSGRSHRVSRVQSVE